MPQTGQYHTLPCKTNTFPCKHKAAFGLDFGLETTCYRVNTSQRGYALLGSLDTFPRRDGIIKVEDSNCGYI